MADKYVQNKLIMWNLSILIPKFRDEGINANAFKALTNATISKIVPDEELRTKFVLKFNIYKAFKGNFEAGEENQRKLSDGPLSITKEEIDLTSDPEENPEGDSKSELISSSFDIEYILSESPDGKEIIDTYTKLGHLDESSSNSLTHILIDFLITQSDDHTIDDDVLEEVSAAITARFPNENKDDYFEIYGNKPRGKLFQYYQIVRMSLAKAVNDEERKDLDASDTSNNVFEAKPTTQSESPKKGDAPMPEWVGVEESNPEMVNLKWDGHNNSLLQGLPYLLANEKFVDTTIICEGQSIKCHKIVLSSYSTHFEKMLMVSPCKHPVIFLADVKFWEIQALIDFIYYGELNIEESKLPRLFEVATALNIQGLANTDMNDTTDDVNGEDLNITESEGCIEKSQDPLSVTPVCSSRKRKKACTSATLVLGQMKPTGTTTKKSKSVQDTGSLEVDNQCMNSNNILHTYMNKRKATVNKVDAQGTNAILRRQLVMPTEPNTPPQNSIRCVNSLWPPLHQLAQIPNRSRKMCPVCSKKASYWCPGCNCGVHVDCFQNLEHRFRPSWSRKKKLPEDSDND